MCCVLTRSGYDLSSALSCVGDANTFYYISITRSLAELHAPGMRRVVSLAARSLFSLQLRAQAGNVEAVQVSTRDAREGGVDMEIEPGI